MLKLALLVLAVTIGFGTPTEAAAVLPEWLLARHPVDHPLPALHFFVTHRLSGDLLRTRHLARTVPSGYRGRISIDPRDAVWNRAGRLWQPVQIDSTRRRTSDQLDDAPW